MWSGFAATRWTTVLVVLCIAASSLALEVNEDQAGSWIDLFDGQTLYGWTAVGDAPWKVVEGALVCEQGTGGLVGTNSGFADFELKARIRVAEGSSTGILLRSPLSSHPSATKAGVLYLGREVYGPEWHDVRVVAEGSEAMAEVDGKPVEIEPGSRKHGHIAFQYHHHGERVEIKDVELRPLGMKPIFNGVDLTGWEIIPGHDSVFTVSEGVLNIKNGNGQIETDEVYKDFVLQLAIISNGEHLNSGVFFRGPKGVFWRGYEAQIRNQWQEGDRGKPVDYGTGGIYGNVPARKVVSSDGAWFVMTIVCYGNHMAVWVDGFQVSDFIDTRPVSTEGDGKAGFVPAAGTFSLQGHDPSTDLSFKDIRVLAYPSSTR